MKICLILFIFVTIFATPAVKAKCYQYELTGQIKILNDQSYFILAEGSLSQVMLAISPHDILMIAPFVDRSVKAHIVSNLPEIQRKSKILKILEIDHSAFDPLNETGANSRKLIKEVKCP